MKAGSPDSLPVGFDSILIADLGRIDYKSRYSSDRKDSAVRRVDSAVHKCSASYNLNS